MMHLVSFFQYFRNGFLAASSQEYAAHIAYILRCDFLTFLRDKKDFQDKFLSFNNDDNGLCRLVGFSNINHS